MKQRSGKGSIKSYEKTDSGILSSAGKSAISVNLTSLLKTNGANKPKGTVIRHVYDWRYLIRFDNEVYPRQREVRRIRICALISLM